MANFTEPANPGFPPVYQLELDDDVIGGEDGVSNRQGKQLAERTAYLKKGLEQESLDRAAADTALAAADTALQQQIGENKTAIEHLKGRGGYLSAHDFGVPAPSQNALTAYALTQISAISDPLDIWNGTRVKNLNNGHVWALANTPDTQPPIFEWADDGPDTVGTAGNDGTLGLAAGEAEEADGSADGFVTVLPSGKMKLIGFERQQRRIAGEYRYLSFLPEPWEMVKYRLMELSFQIIEIALYPELCARKYAGDAGNAAARWWYKCDEDGTRNPAGLYMRVEDGRGLFHRAAGANSVVRPSIDTLYDGNDIGAFLTDKLGSHKHNLSMWSANTQTGPQLVGMGSGWVAGSAIMPDNIFVSPFGNSETAPASLSVYVVISY
jgi:hypothetical protein